MQQKALIGNLNGRDGRKLERFLERVWIKWVLKAEYEKKENWLSGSEFWITGQSPPDAPESGFFEIIWLKRCDVTTHA